MRTLYRRLCDVIEKEHPDVLQAHSPALNGLAAVWAGKKHHLPVLYEQRGLWEDAAVSHGTAIEGGIKYKMSRFLEAYVMDRADGITCICEGLRNDLIARNIPSEKITIIPNAVDVSTFQESKDINTDLRTRLGMTDSIVLGFIGSFYDYEGLDILLASLPIIRRDVPKVKLLLVGGGPVEEKLKEIVTAFGMEKEVMFTGRVPHDKVQDYYNLVDIFVYPRKKMRLTDLVTPLKPLEAMAQHKLVAASDIGGHNELIEDGKTGVLFKPDSPSDLARTIVNLLQNREIWPAMIAEGRKYVEQVRNWKNSIANYPAVFDKIIDKHD